MEVREETDRTAMDMRFAELEEMERTVRAQQAQLRKENAELKKEQDDHADETRRLSHKIRHIEEKNSRLQAQLGPDRVDGNAIAELLAATQRQYDEIIRFLQEKVSTLREEAAVQAQLNE